MDTGKQMTPFVICFSFICKNLLRYEEFIRNYFLYLHGLLSWF